MRFACAAQLKKALHVCQGPRRCEYSGRLYCQECHRGDAAVLPAAVLHGWDFNLRPVCAMAADYLASIAQQPLLCIGAVNPGARCCSSCFSVVL